ncbi:hypothetical protein F5884DRAFT_814580 [Xylogone sp. PMI_703]|nr:hypothetical protein F5884DRAFT_814580 [Xylogone sp. PMI_703]
MLTYTTAPLLLAVSFWLYFTGSFFFDVVHYLLHKCSKSSYQTLRLIGYVHKVHHLYFNRNLRFDHRYAWQNTCIELPLELSCQLVGSCLGYLIAHFLPYIRARCSIEVLYIVFVLETSRVFVVALFNGMDSNHKSYSVVPKDPGTFLIGPQYHALHHINPSAYISSSFRLFDWLFGTSYTLRSRRVTLTGASGAFGNAIKKKLQGEKVTCIQELKFGIDWTFEDYSRTLNVLANTDILILAHGSKGEDAMEANYEAPIAFIRAFKSHYQPRPGNLLLPEVWYVGSEIEIHPTWGLESLRKYSRSKRKFAKHASKYYEDSDILYRHIVPSAFRSRMGWAIMGPDWAAMLALWWIKRGARYVPVTYTGLAFWGYLKWVYQRSTYSNV